MNFDRYTDRAKGFVQSAQSLALRENHQQFTPEHLLKVLLDDPEGLASGLIAACRRRSPRARLQAVERSLGKTAEGVRQRRWSSLSGAGDGASFRCRRKSCRQSVRQVRDGRAVAAGACGRHCDRRRQGAARSRRHCRQAQYRDQRYPQGPHSRQCAAQSSPTTR